ncbi:MAG TPA: DUF262 domain-containing protein [Sphingomicrobium sp.]
MSLFEDTNPHALKDLLAEVHSGQMVLPDFQRDFVWEPGATRELIVSIANNYPAGSLLRVRDLQRAFVAREFEGAPKLNGVQHTFLMLDGQQRMTSLYQAFFGEGEHRYFLNIGKLFETADFDEALFYERTTTKAVKRLADVEEQHKAMILPLSALKTGAGGYLKWVTSLIQKRTKDITERAASKQLDGDELAAALQENQQLQNRLQSIHDQWINTIDDYRFPVVSSLPGDDLLGLGSFGGCS